MAEGSLHPSAAVLGRLSGPLRDREVLVAELTRLGLVHLAPADEAQRAAGYVAIASSGELADLMLLLDGWPANWREAARQGQLNDVDKRIRRRLRRQQRQLARALRDPAHDRHRLRLLLRELLDHLGLPLNVLGHGDDFRRRRRPHDHCHAAAQHRPRCRPRQRLPGTSPRAE